MKKVQEFCLLILSLVFVGVLLPEDDRYHCHDPEE
jgi:hypothetical protein